MAASRLPKFINDSNVDVTVHGVVFVMMSGSRL